MAVTPIITLTTDFGLSDHYVATMKGAILSINPSAAIIDISHDVPTQGVEQAAFLLFCAAPYFPPGTIHVAVVDPGVGTDRRALALVVPDGVFIGPDNGILSAALSDDVREVGSPRPVPLPKDARAFLLSDARFRLEPASNTFHARDIFAPAAAYLSTGIPPSDLGPEVHEITALAPFRAEPRDDGTLVARVIHIDRFGNVITNLRAEQLPQTAFRVEIGTRVIDRLVRTYAECAGLSALVGSSGFVEIALDQHSAATALGARFNDTVVVRPI